VGIYTRLRGRADALIRKYGKVRTFTHTEVGKYNADTGKNDVTKTSTHQIHIVTFPYEIRFVNNTTVRENDIWGLFSAVELGVVPRPGDKMDMGNEGGIFTFGTVKPLSPGGIAIYYECHLSQG
jgi:hypothetical protein